MGYRIVRLGSGYGFALAVTPEDARPEGMALPEGARFFRWADWKIGDHEPDAWNEIPGGAVWGYFSGHADGLGHAELPADAFPTLGDAAAWMRESRERWSRERLAEIERLERKG